VLLGFARW